MDAIRESRLHYTVRRLAELDQQITERVMSALRKRARDFGAPPEPEARENRSKPTVQCDHCDGTGFIDVAWTYPRPLQHGDGKQKDVRVIPATCICDMGGWHRETYLGKAMPTMQWCRDEGLLDSSATTRRAHWLYAQWVYHQAHGLDTTMLEAIEKGAPNKDLVSMLAKRLGKAEAEGAPLARKIGRALMGGKR